MSLFERYSVRGSTRQLTVVVAALVSVFLFALMVVAAVLIWSHRQNILQENKEQLVRFIAGAEVSVNRLFLGIDVLLASTEEGLGQLQSSALTWEAADIAKASKLLRSVADHSLPVRSVVLVDAQGRAMASSDNTGTLPVLELPQAFFREVVNAPFSMLSVSAPMVSFSSSERVVYLARRFQSDRGKLFLVVAEVPVEILVSVLMQGTVLPGLEVTLERSDGHLLLIFPEIKKEPSKNQNQEKNKEYYNQAHTDPILFPPLSELPESPSTWQMQGRTGGASAQVESRRLLYPDLWISAGLSLHEVLIRWRFYSKIVAVVALIFGFIVVAVGVLAVIYIQRMEAARQELAQSKEALDQALESMVSGFILFDAHRQVRQWNHRFEETFPWLLGAMARGIHFQEILEITADHLLVHTTEIERKRWVQRRLRKPNNLRRPYELRLLTGRYIQITERPTPDGGLVFTYHDVTKLHRASIEIEHLAFYDQLTGLPNRRLLLDRLGQSAMAAERTGQIGALLFIDLDDFKSLNDTQGHEAGDQLLKQVANRLRTSILSVETVARLGSDEFVILLNGLSENPTEAGALVRHIGEAVLQSLAKPYLLGITYYQGTCSIGAVLFNNAAEPAAEVLKQASIAMSQNKGNPGEGICFFDPQMQIAICARAQLETDLQTALVQGQFVLHYQPQFTLGGMMVGAEALLRWEHPVRGMVSPGHFIPAAEESDLIIAIGDWVLRTACQQLADWKNNPKLLHLLLAVNVSSRQFSQNDFVEKVVNLIKEMGIRPHLLKLELTESMVLNNVDDTIAKMHLLRTKGVRFSVDDFGTGYSSLSYLTQLPLNQLKIDQSFVRNLGLRPSDDVIVQTIIGMARNLDLEVIAEGVETEEQKSFLASQGCNLYQGYLMGRPMPVEALIATLLAKPALATWLTAARTSAQQPPRRLRCPLWVAGQLVGSVEAGFLDQTGLKALLDKRYQLLKKEHFGTSGTTEWHLQAPPDEVTLALKSLADALRTLGCCGPWRNEQLAVCNAIGQRIGTIERGAVRMLGLATQAVHLVGTTADGRMWVQQRAFNKPNNPGQWDTLMGGMVSAADSLPEALARETWEEAGLRFSALADVVHSGHLDFAMPSAEGDGSGYMRERIDWFSCTVPDGLEPQNQDGEVEKFALLAPEAVRELAAQGLFTLEAGLVLASFWRL